MNYAKSRRSAVFAPNLSKLLRLPFPSNRRQLQKDENDPSTLMYAAFRVVLSSDTIVVDDARPVLASIQGAGEVSEEASQW